MAMSVRLWIGVVAAALLGPPGAAAQPGSVITPRSQDDAMAAELDRHGLHAAVGRVVVHVPAGTLSAREATEFARRLNRELDALEAYAHAPRPWQRKLAKLDYYFPPAMFVSHTPWQEGRVFISFPRIGNGEAPTLHEAAHAVLMPSREFVAAHPELFDDNAPPSTWLYEGLVEYVALALGKERHVADGDPLHIGSIDEIDARCVEILGTPLGAEIAPFIGAAGEPAGLVSRERRRELAPPFSACTTSFNKYLVELFGLDAVIDLFPTPHPEAALEALAHKSAADLRADWRKKIGATP
jgi:hypothetical protein